MTDSLLSMKSLRAGYGDRQVLLGIDWEVSAGTLWAVLGPNGAGKSTLVRAGLGLVHAEGGSVQILGRSVTEWRRRELAKHVALVPQTTQPLEGLLGMDVVLMGRSPHQGLWGLSSSRDVELARQVLAELEALPLAFRAHQVLSGGEQRLLVLARALAQEPRLLFLDEPTAFLDFKHQVDVLRRVKARVRDGLAAVAVLHDVNLATEFADHALLLRDGRVLAAGLAEEVLTPAILESLYGVRLRSATTPDGKQLFGPEISS